MSVIALLAFIGLAVVNWLAVAQEWKEAEYVTKPAVIVALVAFAASGSHPPPWLAVALLLSLLGDVYLMLPTPLFGAGLSAFMFAHLAYIASFDAALGWRFFWFLVVGGAATSLALRILRAVTDDGIRTAVAVYLGVLSLMVASALGAARPLAILGALLFLASDAILAWDRFVQPQPWARLAVMVTYHLGQLGLVWSLRSAG